MGWSDSPVYKVIALQAQEPEFDTQNHSIKNHDDRYL